jgi:hypothetical protein
MEAYRIPGGGGRGTIQDATGSAVTITNWNDAVFRRFCEGFKQGTEDAWNDKLWLVPSGSWGCDLGVWRPNIRCALRIDIVTHAGARHHLLFRCVNLPTGPASHRSFTNPEAHEGQLDSRDGWSSTPPPGSPGNLFGQTYRQFTGAHEIGHHLGLDHVNAAFCVASNQSTNNLICYGGTAYQAGDILGWGSRVERWHDRPWRAALARHIKFAAASWRTVTQRPQPQRIFREGDLILDP